MSQPPVKEITLAVRMDEQNVPDEIHWHATDSPHPEPQSSGAFFLSLWDPAEKSTLRIDLWTKEMQVDHMNAFVLQSLATMADTFERATGNAERAEEIRAFAQELATRLELPSEARS